jgi:hypothetical protein
MPYWGVEHRNTWNTEFGEGNGRTLAGDEVQGLAGRVSGAIRVACRALTVMGTHS